MAPDAGPGAAEEVAGGDVDASKFSAQVQQRDCPPLRALVEAVKRADATPVGQQLWGLTSEGGGPLLELGREAPDGAAVDARPPPPDRPAGLRLARHSTREVRGVVRQAWHFVYVRRDAAAAQAYLQHNGNEMLELQHGMVRLPAAGLPLVARMMCFAILPATRGTAAFSAWRGTVAISGRGPFLKASVCLVFMFGDAVYKLFLTEHGLEGGPDVASNEQLLCRAIDYVMNLTRAPRAGAAGADGAEAGIIGGLSGELLDKVMALPPMPEDSERAVGYRLEF